MVQSKKVLLAIAAAPLAFGLMASAVGFKSDTAELIIPGEIIGHLRLGADENTATAKFPKSYYSEGAAGHSVEIWKSQDGNTVAVASEVDSHGGLTRPIVEIEVSSPYFRTRGGIGPGSSLSAVEQAYPNARAVRHAPKSAYVGKIALLDDKTHGIAFQFPVASGKLSKNAHCTAVVIYAKGTGAMELYFPLYIADPSGAISSMSDSKLN